MQRSADTDQYAACRLLKGKPLEAELRIRLRICCTTKQLIRTTLEPDQVQQEFPSLAGGCRTARRIRALGNALLESALQRIDHWCTFCMFCELPF